MKKVLILGSTGMLGTMMYSVLDVEYDVGITYRSEKLSSLCKINNKYEYYFNVQENNYEKRLIEIINSFNPHVIINCIGVIKPYCRDDDPSGVRNAIMINAYFPHVLSKITSTINEDIKIIQIATDCVYDGKSGNYSEKEPHNALDVYGKTKSLGEVQDKNFINIRSSIIGPEIKNKLSLLEWVLSREENSNVPGYQNHIWNGVTTLQFAQFCKKVIEHYWVYRNLNHTLHLILNETITKYRLLLIINDVFNRNIKINKYYMESGEVNRTLTSNYIRFSEITMVEALKELNNYINNNYHIWGKNYE